MRLRRLDLEFFGHFTGRSFDFGEGGGADVHVVYGPNEAGKTTLMEGYLRLLFGFAARGEPYDFKHGRSALRVSAELEIDGAPRRVARVPKRGGGLLDGTGAALPESALAPALAGLSQEDYRKLLCLDDDTIEKGGEEIAASEGDIGRLLFSAAAGVSDLSEVLEGAETEARNLHLKGGSKSAFAGLRRRHEEVEDRIRDIDVSAHRYRQLREAVTAAEAEEAEARAARRARLEARDRLRALVEALPLQAELAELEDALAPLAAYPEALDIDPEALVALMQQRVRHASEADRLERELERARAARAEIPLDPELAAFGPRLDDLRPLRDRCAAAEADLPRRQAELAALEADMAARLAEIGADPGDDPAAAIPGAPALRTLERRVQEAGEAAAALANARREAAEAEAAHADAERRCAAAEEALSDLPDLAPVLERHDAERVAEAAAAARQAVRLAERRREAALAEIALGPAVFDAVPAMPLSGDAAAALAGDHAAADREVARMQAALETAAETEARLRAEIEAREAAPELASDAEAAGLRAERDRLWTAHRAALTAESADAFERALRADDAAGAARQAQAGELGAIREGRLRLAEAERARSAAEEALDGAEAERSALSARLGEALAAAGLPEDTAPEAFAAWARRAETAAAATREAEREARAAAPALDAAERLRGELAGALDAGDAPLEAVMDMARGRIARRSEQAQAAAAVREALGAAEAALARRRAERDEAAARQEAAQAALGESARAALGPAAVAPEDALPVLRALREMEATRAGLARQVAGMERDAETFARALAPLRAGRPDTDAPAPVAAYDALAAAAAEARAAAERAEAAEQEIRAMEQGRADARAELERIDAEAELLARAFDPSIPTGTLDALRAAVTAAREANEMRARRAALERRLLAALSVPSRAEAEAALAERTRPGLDTALAEAEADLAALEERCRTAGAALGAARQALAAVTGGAEIAAMVAQRQTLELEMEETMLRHLELRLGHRLAETAIRRYRDVHRSGMMKAAEAAFAELTAGAYSRLTVQAEGAREVLVAVQAESGAAKRVHDMSKGTRFQLYLALRAAAYDQMVASGAALPFFCDDVFETFDEDRTRAACGLMRRIGRSGQAVYLTHHRHVVEIAREVCGDELRVHRL